MVSSSEVGGIEDTSGGETGDVGCVVWLLACPALLLADEPWRVGGGGEHANMVDVNGSCRRRLVRCKGGDGISNGKFEADVTIAVEDGGGGSGGAAGGGDGGPITKGGDSDIEGEVE